MHYALKECKRKNVHEVILKITTRDLISFYRQFGFALIHIPHGTTNYALGRALEMDLTLKPSPLATVICKSLDRIKSQLM